MGDIMYDLNQLNELQKKIVLDTDGYILVSAGAGSGKTRLLTHRVAYLIKEKGVSAQNILAITFTNKATIEMKERISAMTNSEDVWISTFHSMCARILRQNISVLDGFNRYFTIYDESDKEKLIKQICKNNDVDKDLVSSISNNISNAKNMGLNAVEYQKLTNYDRNWNTICEIYQKYDDELKNNNALDFDDLLMKTLYILENNERVRNYYQTQFRYIMVDEFQDTNTVQYKILKQLVGVHHNLFVVGDEDQSIYGWRGANIENIKNFIKDFQGVKVYKLEQNYRSTKNILECANKLIENNTSRIEKTLFTENEEGEKVNYKICYDEKEEGDWVCRKISDLHYSGVDYDEIGILMRINSTSRIFEEKLLNYNIPYKISGGQKFYDRMEIKNILAYLCLIVNDKDNVALERIINFPRRGIGDSTIDKINQIAKQYSLSEWEVINKLTYFGLDKLSGKVKPFVDLIIDLKALADNSLLADFVDSLISKTQILEVFNSGTEDDDNRKRNIREFAKSVKEWSLENPGATLVEYLESVTLQNSASDEDLEGGKVTLSTAHAAKGLEFDYVFVVACEEGMFPLSRSIDNGDVEEERRLMYVAVTRAKKQLFISRAKSRMVYGCTGNTMPSRFLDEMGLKSMEKFQKSFDFDDDYIEDKGYEYIPNKSYDFSSKFSFGGGIKLNNEAPKTKPQITTDNTNYVDNKLWQTKLNSQKKNFDEYQIGVKVLHPKFGIGEIVNTQIIDNNNYVTVKFVGVGNKTLALSFAPLQILKNK